MWIYALKRILLVIPVALTVVSAVFFFMRLLPGNPADLVLGEQALATDKELWLKARGLDEPVLEQYRHFAVGSLTGDFGRSFSSDRKVGELIRERYPATLELTGLAMLFGIAIAFPLGMWGAISRGRWPDHLSRFLSLTGISVPTLFTGPLLMLLFSVYLGWLPVSGRVLPGSCILPALTLGFALSAFLSRIIRNTLLDILREDFVRTARAKGLRKVAILWKHVLKAGMVPILSVLALQFGALLAGAVVTEKIFAWPGMGSLLIESIQKRDYAVVQGVILVMSLSYVAVNVLADLLFALVDPRIALGKKE